MWRLDDCFIHGCVFCYWMCRSDVSVILFRMSFFVHQSFWLCRYGFLTFPCLWEISPSGQMISGTVSWLLGLDRIFKYYMIF